MKWLMIKSLQWHDSSQKSWAKLIKKSYKNIGIYNIGYITTKKIYDYKSIYDVNGYIEEKMEILIFNSTDENKELIKKDVWNEIKNKIEAINSGECDYQKDFIKIKFNSDDDLPLNKPLKFHMNTIIIRSVFEEDGKLHQQVFLDDALYELRF